MMNFARPALLIAFACGTALAGGKVYLPRDGTPFQITQEDVVRFTGPITKTRIMTEVKVIEGEAEVLERTVSFVAKGKVMAITGAPEFEVKPKAGKKGKIKVRVTQTFPGLETSAEVKEYEFEVK